MTFLVKIVVVGSAFVKAAILARAPSKAASASWASAYTPRWTLALCSRRWAASASITTSGFCEVALESR